MVPRSDVLSAFSKGLLYLHTWFLKLVKFQFFSSEFRKVISELGLEIETPVQAEAIPTILSGDNVLIVSPTGTGKTEAALLPILENIRTLGQKQGIKAIYITPLRALNRDMLRRVEMWAKQLGLTVDVRHGDTTQSNRRKQAISPPDVLITTPETLQSILIGSRLRSNLKELRCVVIDEIHQLAKDRRGSQLSFGLERLRLAAGREFQRIGLSATIADTHLIGEFLCGRGRSFSVVDTTTPKKRSSFHIELPRPLSEDVSQAKDLFISPQTLARLKRIVDLVDGHDHTLIFVNSRTLAEELGSRLKVLGVQVGIHHGSLSREERERIEVEFRTGQTRALVCTSTLELGIDIGSVDLVIQYMSPRQVNSLVQRVGRSGHELTRHSDGIILSVSAEDVLECSCISEEAVERRYERVMIPRAPLDVLAHQVAGLLLECYQIDITSIMEASHASFSYENLTRNDLLSVLRFMETMGYLAISGESVVRRSRCRNYYLENLSTIRDERRYIVVDISTQNRVGMLGEEFMFLHADVGIRFIIKGRGWQIESIQGEEVYVTPVQDLSAAIPGWDGELMPIPKSVATSVGSFRRRSELDPNGVWDLNSDIEKSAREAVKSELDEQSIRSRLPTDKRIVIEQFKNFLIIHTSAGDRINSTLGELFEERLLRMGGLIRNWWRDGYRILVELSSHEFVPEKLVERLFAYDSTVPGFIDAILRKHFPFGYDMKFIAERFGALKRGRLLSGEAIKELGVKFRFTPIYDETLREAFETRVDVAGATDLLRKCSSHEIELCVVKTETPTPLAMYILSRYADSEDYVTGSNSVESIRQSIEKEIVSLLCLNCAELKEFQRVGDLGERLRCEKCESMLLAVIFYSARFASNALLKKKSRRILTKEENDFLAKLRRSADVVLSYGKRGVIAQCVYGIGPQMAGRVLSRMHDSDEAFYEDLLRAKLNFIRTKRYWN